LDNHSAPCNDRFPGVRELDELLGHVKENGRDNC